MEAALWDTFFQVGQNAFAQGDIAQAAEAFEAAVAAAREMGSEDSRLALSLNNLAAVRQSQGRLPEALALSEEALRTSRASLGEEHPEVGMGWVNMAQLLAAGGRLGEAEAAYLCALRILDRVEDRQPHREALEGHAQLLLEMERLPQAAQVLESLRQALTPDEPESSEWLARTLHVLSNLYDALGQPELAATARQECLQRLRQLWGEHSLERAQVVLNMADSLFSNGHFREAAALYGEGSGILERCFPAQDPRLHSTQMNRLAALKESGQTAEAEELARGLLASWGEDGQERPRLCNELGLLCFLRQDYAEAEQHFQSALQLWADQGGQSAPSRASCLYNLASAATGAGHLDLARDTFRSALTLAEEHLTLEHALTQRILLNFMHLLQELKMNEEAAELAARLERISKQGGA